MRKTPSILVGVLAFGSFTWSEQPVHMPPSAVAAVGDLSALEMIERAAFEVDADFFRPIHKPGPYDWQTTHPEPAQTFDEYAEVLDVVQPKSRDQRLCILPIGEFKSATAPSLARLSSFCASYFGRKTELLGAIKLDKVPAKRRINKLTQKRQIMSGGILEWLEKQKPSDAYAVIGVTMEDLYPEEGWNFVFGEANLYGGTGVFSFARYDPAFFGDPSDKQTPHLVLERSIKVLSHEMGHMFGLHHCAFLECNMNGSNHLEETDKAPIHLCPICLRKLHAAGGFDLLQREKDLMTFYIDNHFDEEAEWTYRRIQKLETGAGR